MPTTANDLYYVYPSQSETYDISRLFGCYYNHFKELEAYYNEYIDPVLFKDQDRIKIKTLQHFDFDVDRYWNMSTAMVVHLEKDDRS